MHARSQNMRSDQRDTSVMSVRDKISRKKIVGIMYYVRGGVPYFFEGRQGLPVRRELTAVV